MSVTGRMAGGARQQRFRHFHFHVSGAVVRPSMHRFADTLQRKQSIVANVARAPRSAGPVGGAVEQEAHGGGGTDGGGSANIWPGTSTDTVAFDIALVGMRRINSGRGGPPHGGGHKCFRCRPAVVKLVESGAYVCSQPSVIGPACPKVVGTNFNDVVKFRPNLIDVCLFGLSRSQV